MDYFEYVKNDKKNDEISVLINKLTTNHTYFLRENEHFEFYKQQVLPWVDGNGQNQGFTGMECRMFVGAGAIPWR